MNIEKRVKLSKLLPPTPCTPDMRQRVVDVAKLQGVSIAEVQRAAVALFLSEVDRDATALSNQSIEKAAS